MAVLIAVAAVVFLSWSVKRENRKDADESLRGAVQTVADRLSAAAADGRLTRSEVNDIALRSGLRHVVSSEREDAITLQAEVKGMAPFFGGAMESGCYLYSVEKPVTSRPRIDIKKIDAC